MQTNKQWGLFSKVRQEAPGGEAPDDSGEKRRGSKKGEACCSAIAFDSGTKPWLFLTHKRQTHPAQGTWHCLWAHRGRPGDGSGIAVDAAALVARGTYCMSQGQEGFPLHPEACRTLQVCFLTLCSPESRFTRQGHSLELHLWESHQSPHPSSLGRPCAVQAGPGESH